MTSILMLIAPNNFRDEELLDPKKFFEKRGIKVTVVSTNIGEAAGMLGAKIMVDKIASDVSVDDYDAVVFVGGAGVEEYKLYKDDNFLCIAREALKANKIVGAICLAPMILAAAGLLTGKRATAFSSSKEFLESRGAIYTGESIEQDGSIITADGPASVNLFASTIVECLRE
ncbi:MAG: DJ-1/PfpI family protein [Candidatus Aenigmatarchaeota archaeon]